MIKMYQKKLIFLVVLQIFVISTIFLVGSLSTINYLPPLADHKSSTLSINDEYIMWDVEGTIISNASANQQVAQICSDGAGGAIITWRDYRNGDWDIYAQKINSTGNVQWTADGVAICTESDDQQLAQICSDGAGGAIITWRDYRTGSNEDIYTQKIDSSGNIQWTANGTAICTQGNTQTDPQICSDGAGGAIITWDDSRSAGGIYAQKILSSGGVQWTADGKLICSITASNPQICSDGAGGAIITWVDTRFGDMDIFAQKILTNGSIQWTTNGEIISTASLEQNNPQICSDGAGGAIITWQDMETGPTFDIYAQRISSIGNIQWVPNGTAICTEIDWQQTPQICSDGAGGAIITWNDYRPAADCDIYAQKILTNGSIQWTTNGTAICTAYNIQGSPQICSDGAGGAIITWKDYRAPTNIDIYTQKINSSGSLQWTADGKAICTVSENQDSPQICSDGAGGAIITWSDYRSGNNYDIYAQKIITDAIPTSNHPDDISTTMDGSETIAWALYDDWDGGKYRVWLDGGIWVDWTGWNKSNILIVPIYRGVFGTYNYTIEYYDSQNQYGISDSVIVTIINTTETPESPSEESPIFISGGQGGGDVASFLLSPLGLGIIAGFGALFLILLVIGINNNKTFKELDKKISETPITKKSIKK